MLRPTSGNACKCEGMSEAQLGRQIDKWQRQVAQRPQALTTEQVDEGLQNLHRVLSSGTPAAAIALGNLIGDVVVQRGHATGPQAAVSAG